MRTTSTMILAGAIATVLLGALAPASARELELSAGPGVLAARSTTMDAVTDDDLIPLASIRFALELPELGAGRLLELAWRAGTTQARDFQDLDAELLLREIEVAFRVERGLGRRVRAFARAGVVATFADLSLDGGGLVLEDDARTISGIAGAGLDLIVLRAGGLELGFRAEAGVRAGGSLSFAPRPAVESDEARIRTQAVELGAMDLSGLTAGLAVVGRF